MDCYIWGDNDLWKVNIFAINQNLIMNFEQARSNMVLNQLRANRIRDIDLIEKIEDFPREDLFPKDLKHLSYSDQIYLNH